MSEKPKMIWNGQAWVAAPANPAAPAKGTKEPAPIDKPKSDACPICQGTGKANHETTES